MVEACRGTSSYVRQMAILPKLKTMGTSWHMGMDQYLYIPFLGG